MKGKLILPWEKLILHFENPEKLRKNSGKLRKLRKIAENCRKLRISIPPLHCVCECSALVLPQMMNMPVVAEGMLCKYLNI